MQNIFPHGKYGHSTDIIKFNLEWQQKHKTIYRPFNEIDYKVFKKSDWQKSPKPFANKNKF